jgi:hypothetical protein
LLYPHHVSQAPIVSVVVTTEHIFVVDNVHIFIPNATAPFLILQANTLELTPAYTNVSIHMVGVVVDTVIALQ